MSWIKHHQESERLASQAQIAVHKKRLGEALKLYSLAADAEESAIADLDLSKTRTLGISVVSAAWLRYKAEQFSLAEAVADRWLEFDRLPAFARDQLCEIRQKVASAAASVPDEASSAVPSVTLLSSASAPVPVTVWRRWWPLAGATAVAVVLAVAVLVWRAPTPETVGALAPVEENAVGDGGGSEIGVSTLPAPGASGDFVPVTDEMLQNPAPEDWLTWRRTQDAWGYSPLDQVNRDNVGNLCPPEKWASG